MEIDAPLNAKCLLEDLTRTVAYPTHPERIEVLETHISWIFLAGEHAYKVKKGIKTPFLDYRGLDARRIYCNEEFRINSQFAPDLYLGVVPIVRGSAGLIVEADGEPAEYAVKMRRFPAGSLLVDRLTEGTVSVAEVVDLAHRIADIHASAVRVAPNDWRIQSSILGNAIENLTELQPTITGDMAAIIRSLQIWTRDFYEQLEPVQQKRFLEGRVCECHGDMHAGNIVTWNNCLTPFDGIEFNEAFRCIDVLNDIAFLSMDLFARGEQPLRNAFVNAYVERTADRSALGLLRWYEVYRALVRAKVAHLRWQQLAARIGHGDVDDAAVRQSLDDCHDHIRLAHRLAEQVSPRLTITYGPSGSGKSVASHEFLMQRGAIRLRADVERKRVFGLQPAERPDSTLAQQMYSHEASAKLYSLLLASAEELLQAGYSVIIDATFLKLNQRRAARELAARLEVEFDILNCDQPEDILRERVAQRSDAAADPSDADLHVLAQQLATCEPLTADELTYTLQPVAR